MNRQEIIELKNFIEASTTKNVLLVHGSSFVGTVQEASLKDMVQDTDISLHSFSGFTVNPKYEEVVEGVQKLKESNCDSIVAIGGGSAIDVAKCIKLYSGMSTDFNFLDQKIIPNEIRLAAIPTTAGTGSEATRFAVIYYNGEKQSVTHESCTPDLVVFDESFLETLPLYQKKVTMMDALCHAIESFWSVNSTEESKRYSKTAIEMILANGKRFLFEPFNRDVAKNMLLASNYAGKAIDITQTTAGHAMAYKLTSMFGLSHGHAVALCVKELWPYTIGNIESCIDARGKEYLGGSLNELAVCFGVNDATEATVKFKDIIDTLELNFNDIASENDIKVLVDSVNATRLKNMPIQLNSDAIELLYRRILKVEFGDES